MIDLVIQVKLSGFWKYCGAELILPLLARWVVAAAHLSRIGEFRARPRV
jgi:hypothetical protein